MVEAINQLYRREAIVLACAPSNSAADLFVERLCKTVQKRDMLRLTGTHKHTNRDQKKKRKSTHTIAAISRPLDAVPDQVKQFCLISNNSFRVPLLSEIQNKKVSLSSLFFSFFLFLLSLSLSLFVTYVCV